MSRKFQKLSNDSASVDAQPVSSNPWTMWCTFLQAVKNSNQTLLFYGNSGDTSTYTQLLTLNGSGYLKVNASHLGTSYTNSTNVADCVWHTAMVVEYSSGGFQYAELWLDGVLQGTTTGTATSSGVGYFDTFAVGRKMHYSPTEPTSATIAEVGIASVRATYYQAQALACGVKGRRVFGTDCKGDWPLFGLHSPEVDLSGSRNDLTLSGTLLDDHAPVTPFTPRWAASSPSVGTGGVASTRCVYLDDVLIRVPA